MLTDFQKKVSPSDSAEIV